MINGVADENILPVTKSRIYAIGIKTNSETKVADAKGKFFRR